MHDDKYPYGQCDRCGEYGYLVLQELWPEKQRICARCCKRSPLLEKIAEQTNHEPLPWTDPDPEPPTLLPT